MYSKSDIAFVRKTIKELMQNTNNNIIKKVTRIILRIAGGSLSFAVADDSAINHAHFEPYIVRSGISMAANLREAFKSSELLQGDYRRAMIMIDTPTMLLPVEERTATEVETMYNYTFTGHEGDVILSNVMPNLNVMVVFSLNKDLKLVIDDHFDDVIIVPIVQPIWSYLHQRSFTGIRNKLYGYFHDKQLDLFSFNKNRFKFCNTFDATYAQDNVYYLLNVWKQLGLDAEKDELHLLGDIAEKDWLMEALHLYVHKIHEINLAVDFNNAPITQVKGLPVDLLTLLIKGR